MHLDIPSLAEIDPPILARLILSSVEKLDPDIRLDRDHIESIIDLLKSARTISFNIPGELMVYREENLVIIRAGDIPALPPPPAISFRLSDLPLTLEVGPHKLIFCLETSLKPRTFPIGDPSHDLMTVALPEGSDTLILRPPEPGDRMSPLGMGGHTKKLWDIFIDRKVPRRSRLSQPVLVNGSDNRILALPVLGIASENREKAANYLSIQICSLPEDFL